MTSSTIHLEKIKDAERDHRLLEHISQIIKILNQKGIKTEKRLDEILCIILHYMSVEQGSIMMLEKGNLIVEAATRKAIIGERQPVSSNSIAGQVAQTKQPLFIPDISKDAKFQDNTNNKHYKKNALLSIPVISKGSLLGVINITDKAGDRDLLQEDITYLLDFSGIIISILVQQRLQKELRHKKTTLKKRNKELKKQEQLKNNLYQMLIHDLKAPLAEVVANLDILSYSISGDNKEFLEAAQMSCDRTVRMVTNLVSINKIEDGKLEIYHEEVDPLDLINEATSAITGLAKIKDVQLITEVSNNLPTIYLDRVLILRVLQNLLTNALGYTTSSTNITVGCHIPPGTKKLEFFVQDQGPGIAVDKQEHIFEKYSRISDKQNALVGTGMGLYFCKLAVEVHRGKIGITSEPGQGCRFNFSLAL